MNAPAKIEAASLHSAMALAFAKIDAARLCSNDATAYKECSE